MGLLLFLLFTTVCISSIYIVHKYFGKHEFYLLGIIYTILSFFMSFKLINVFGMDINPSIIFTSGLFMIIYYFINRYDENEYKRFICLILVTSLVCNLFLLSTSLMIPSIYDRSSNLYYSLIFDNFIIFILYPITLFITSLLCAYSFKIFKTSSLILRLKGIFLLQVFFRPAHSRLPPQHLFLSKCFLSFCLF